MIDHLRNQTAYIITSTTDRHGDQTETSRKATKVRFRYITDVDKGINSEGLRSDAIIWFDKDEDVSEGTLVEVDDAMWRIERLIKARKMTEEVQFLKAFVERHSE